jgi:hypothetical protein
MRPDCQKSPHGPLFHLCGFDPLSNPLSQENGVDTLNSNGLSLDVVAGHRLRRTPRTPPPPTPNPQVSRSNPEDLTRNFSPKSATGSTEIGDPGALVNNAGVTRCWFWSLLAPAPNGEAARKLGRLEQRSWETDDGTDRSKVEIMAHEIGSSLRFATAGERRTERRQGAELHRWESQRMAPDSFSAKI